MTDTVEQEYYSFSALVSKLGLDRGRVRTLREKTYQGKIPGAIKILGRWSYRRIDIDKALLNGGF